MSSRTPHVATAARPSGAPPVGAGIRPSVVDVRGAATTPAGPPTGWTPVAISALVALGLVALHLMGGGALAAPPVGGPDAVLEWARRREPVAVAMALVRLVGLAVGYHLVLVTLLAAVARALRSDGLARLASAVTLPPFRSLVHRTLGVGISVAILGTTAAPAGALPGRPAAASAPMPSGPGAAPAGPGTIVIERLAPETPTVIERIGPDDAATRPPRAADGHRSPTTATLRVERPTPEPATPGPDAGPRHGPALDPPAASDAARTSPAPSERRARPADAVAASPAVPPSAGTPSADVVPPDGPGSPTDAESATPSSHGTTGGGATPATPATPAAPTAPTASERTGAPGVAEPPADPGAATPGSASIRVIGGGVASGASTVRPPARDGHGAAPGSAVPGAGGVTGSPAATASMRILDAGHASGADDEHERTPGRGPTPRGGSSPADAEVAAGPSTPGAGRGTGSGPGTASMHVARVGDTPPSPDRATPVPIPRLHTVVAGDHLWSLAAADLGEHLGRAPTDVEVAVHWTRLLAANPQLPDPDLLLPGQRITLPPVPR